MCLCVCYMYVCVLTLACLLLLFCLLLLYLCNTSSGHTVAVLVSVCAYMYVCICICAYRTILVLLSLPPLLSGYCGFAVVPADQAYFHIVAGMCGACCPTTVGICLYVPSPLNAYCCVFGKTVLHSQLITMRRHYYTTSYCYCLLSASLLRYY